VGWGKKRDLTGLKDELIGLELDQIEIGPDLGISILEGRKLALKNFVCGRLKGRFFMSKRHCSPDGYTKRKLGL
jgi:hypothetical protein